MSSKESPKSLLVIQLRRLGDVLVTTPAVEALRLAYPSAKIDFLVEAPGDQLLSGNTHLDEVVVYDAKRPLAMIRMVRARKYDWVIDFLGTPRSAIVTALSGANRRIGPSHVFHRWAYSVKFPKPKDHVFVAQVKLDFLKGALGVEAPPKVRTSFPVPKEARVRAGFALKELGIHPGEFVLAVMPFSRRITREWPLEHFIALLRGFHKDRPNAKSLIFWGGKGERAGALKLQAAAGFGVHLIPDTGDLQFLGGLMARCDAAITCDNGPKHIAQAVGVPTLTIHGSTQPEDWNPPDDPRFVPVRRDELFCIGCSKNVCPYALECLKDLEPKRVLDQLEGFIDGLRQTTERTVQQ